MCFIVYSVFIVLQVCPSQKLPKGQSGCEQSQVLIGNFVIITLPLKREWKV